MLPDLDAIFRPLDPPLWLVTAAHGPARGGLLATFVMRASIVTDLPRVLVGLGKIHHTWDLVERSGAFGLHWLDATQQELAIGFGSRSGREVDKFAGRATETGPLGVPWLADAPARLACRVEARFDTGDRTLYLGEVVAGAITRPDARPLTAGVFFRNLDAPERELLATLYADDAAVDRATIDAWRGTLHA